MSSAPSPPGPIVIVGAGIGGLRTADALRANGYAGKLIVVGPNGVAGNTCGKMTVGTVGFV